MFRIRGGRALAVAAVMTALGSASAQAAITGQPNSAAGATEIANAIAANPAQVTGADFAEHPPLNAPNGVADEPLSFFPTSGSTFGILTSGQADLADNPNDSGSTGTDDQGPLSRGPSAQDISIIAITVNVPQGTNCLGFDFAFYSDEFPEFVGGSVSDAFVAELDNNTWQSTSGGEPPNAPDNFAFDSNGNPVSINTTGELGQNAANAAGTTYDGATPLLSAQTAVTPGAHTLYLSIFDQGDRSYDSAVFVDNLRFGFVPDAATDCAEGAEVKEFDLGLDPPTATGDTGTDHTVTATLTEGQSGAPIAADGVQFSVSGANPQAATVVQTDAQGEAAFTYPGTNVGDDVITACYDDDGDDNYCEAGETQAFAQMTWEQPPAPTLEITPAETTQYVGARVNLHVSFRDGSNSLIDRKIIFTRTGANPDTTTRNTGYGTGELDYGYVPGRTGDDLVTACFDVDADAACESGEPSDSSIVHVVPARTFTGEAPITYAGNRAATVMPTLYCDAAVTRTPKLTVNWKAVAGNAAQSFTLTGLNSLACTGSGLAAGAPTADFNVAEGTGSGTVNGHPATISFRLEDNGEPGTRDRVTLTISSPGYPNGDLTVTGAALTKKNLDAAGVSIS